MKIYIGEFEGNHWAVDESVYYYANSHIKGRKSVTDYLLKRSILCSDSLVQGLKVGDVLPECESKYQEKEYYTGNWKDCTERDYKALTDRYRRIMLVPVEAKQEQVLYDCEHCGWSGTEVKTIHLEDRCPRCNSLDINTYSEAPKPKPQEQGERKLNYHKVLAETPPEVKKEVSDWMDEQDRIHSSLPVEFADWLGYHLYHYNRVERKWERHMTPPPNKYTTSEAFEIFIQSKMLEQDEDWLYQNWCSIWSLAYKLSKSDFLTKMKQDYFIQANKVK